MILVSVVLRAFRHAQVFVIPQVPNTGDHVRKFGGLTQLHILFISVSTQDSVLCAACTCLLGGIKDAAVDFAQNLT